jgi:membrane-bound serine protease (ClpP class)
VVFIIHAVVLFIVDLKAPTHGFLTAGGVVAFVLGSILLFPPWRTPSLPAAAGLPVAPVIHVSVVTIVVMTLLVVAFFTFVLGKGIGAQARRIAFGGESLVGGSAVVVTPLVPEGLIRMGGEQWSARATQGSVSPGEKVTVVGREGLCLLVRRVAQEGGT